jgi:hypothetical protein
MLQGFQSYNASIEQTSLLFNYMPKAQSYIIEKVREPIDSDDGILEDKETLDLTSISMNDYSITATFMGKSNGDPSSVPSRYIEYLTEKVKTKYGDPYFVNISYSGFSKVSSSDWETYTKISTDGKTTYDTIFTFSISMNVQVGSDEANATIDLEPSQDDEEVTE